MKLTIYTPGDLIIRRGEIAREMYLISDGIVQIIGYVTDIVMSYNIENLLSMTVWTLII